MALALFNFLALVSVAISEPLTTLKVALIAFGVATEIWSLATPFITTLLRTLTHSLEVHVWIAGAYTDKMVTAMEVISETLSTQKERLDQIGKRIDEVERQEKAEE